MKIILLADVKHVGKKDEIVDVNDGYARNYLINKKLAVEATIKNLNELKLKQLNKEKIEKEKYEKALKLKEILENDKVRINISVGKNGKLFGSISSKEIAEFVKEQFEWKLIRKKFS